MNRPCLLLWMTLVTLATAGCGASDDVGPYTISCRSDSECEGEAVCFIDGCGDPGRNIVVEVVPNPKGGLHAQDFPVDELRSQQNIELFDPALLQGQVSVAGVTSPISYSAPITLRMTGESLLIPGVVRRHESTFTPDNGLYTLPVGSGRYNVTLIAANAELPPMSNTRDVQPGHAVRLDFTLPALTELVRLSGKVLRTAEQPVGVELEAQALDEELRPLSQRVPVSRDRGEFTLSLPPSALLRSTVIVQVVPTSAEALVPQKQFIVNPRQALQAPLLLGDYGEPVTFRGRVLDADGNPVPQAAVYLQGKVGGGGQYRSRKVLTDANGFFELLTLPSAAESMMTLHAVPPPGSPVGFTLRSLSVPRNTTTQGPDVVCGARVKVRGTLRMPSGSLWAAGVRVVAEPLDAVPGWPVPSFSVEAARPTTEEGRFELALDPGQYRFDFIPTGALPRVSRIVTVRPGGDGILPDGSMELAPFTLSNGRRITGLVSFGGELRNLPTAPYASIRFFRVVHVEGKPSALLLTQTLTDQNGTYSTTLPTR
jgi:hypothetical protein